ncbi:hypothetical protein [Micromonospora sp. 067-2]|uniref:hypothetical protein n=1 Tax=Micromonospora sp. 067-2 TaxID=2789270 RepID=UPI00397AB92A
MALDQRDCTVRRYPDGAATITGILVDPGGRASRWVLVQRAEGTSVSVRVDNISVSADGRPETTAGTLTLDQLVAIGRSAGLTLYP